MISITALAYPNATTLRDEYLAAHTEICLMMPKQQQETFILLQH